VIDMNGLVVFFLLALKLARAAAEAEAEASTVITAPPQNEGQGNLTEEILDLIRPFISR